MFIAISAQLVNGKRLVGFASDIGIIYPHFKRERPLRLALPAPQFSGVR